MGTTEGTSGVLLHPQAAADSTSDTKPKKASEIQAAEDTKQVPGPSE